MITGIAPEEPNAAHPQTAHQLMSKGLPLIVLFIGPHAGAAKLREPLRVGCQNDGDARLEVIVIDRDQIFLICCHENKLRTNGLASQAVRVPIA